MAATDSLTSRERIVRRDREAEVERGRVEMADRIERAGGVAKLLPAAPDDLLF